MGSSGAGLDIIHAALDAGSDPRQFARQVVDYLRNLLLVITSNAASVDASADIRSQMAHHSSQFTAIQLLQIIRQFNEAAAGLQSSWQPALPLEMAFLEALAVKSHSSNTAGGQDYGSGDPAPQKATASRKEKRSESQQDAQHVPAASVEDDAGGSAYSAAGDTGSFAGNDSDQLFNRVIGQWRQITIQVGQVSKQTQALLNSCKPFGVKDGVLFLGFNGDFTKSKMEKGENIAVTCQVIQEVLGQDVPLRCFVAAGLKGALPADVDSDGMVATALRDLGGEVVDIH